MLNTAKFMIILKDLPNRCCIVRVGTVMTPLSVGFFRPFCAVQKLRPRIVRATCSVLRCWEICRSWPQPGEILLQARKGSEVHSPENQHGDRWKIPMFNRKYIYIFNWLFFHCHVSFRGCNQKSRTQSCLVLDVTYKMFGLQ